LDGSYADSFAFHFSDPNEIIDIVGQLADKSSFGVDNIPVSLNKQCITDIAEPLSFIINCSFRTGCFPSELKIAKVCLIYMGGSHDFFSNYRPSFSNIFEKAVYNRLVCYLDAKNILINNQYEFRPRHSTSMAILDMYEKISKSLDNREFTIGIVIDLSKAFDTFNHNILLGKLEHYGVRGLKLKWFSDYLSNREQYVYYNNKSSCFMSVTCGVP